MTPAPRPRRRVAIPQGRLAIGDAAPFFGPPVDPPERPAYVPQPWMRAPSELLPAPFPLHQLLGITDDAIAVILSKVRVWPTGLTFQLRMTARPGDKDAKDAVNTPEFYGEAGGFGAAHLAKRFRLGIAYDDGRTATNLEIHAEHANTIEPDALLRLAGGHGGTDGPTTTHWVWPLPETGDLTMVTAWAARGLPEQRTVLDGDTLRAAAAASRAAEIWPGAQMPPPTRIEDDDGW